MQMERFGIRYVAGSFDTPGYIECVRSGMRIPTLPKGDVLYVSTSGFADEIVPSAEFRSGGKDCQWVKITSCGSNSILIEQLLRAWRV